MHLGHILLVHLGSQGTGHEHKEHEKPLISRKTNRFQVVLHFPMSTLTSYVSLIFASCCQRLSCEPDATAHQRLRLILAPHGDLTCPMRMLHVVILELLRKLDPPTRQRLLELALRWRRTSPLILAECLGLFTEAEPDALRQVLPCLAELLAEEAWQVRYAVCKSLERILKASSQVLNALFVEGGT